MEVVSTFFVAFAFSFVGMIPPGTLNITAMQLGLDKKIQIAWRLAFAAAMVEYPYAWIAVEFQSYITRSVEFTPSLHLVSALVMISLGLFILWSSSGPTQVARRFEASGFRRGIALGLLNPLAVPFWLAMTAYLKSYGWVDLSDATETHAYLFGVSMGTLVLLMVVAYLAQRVVEYFKGNTLIKKTPGVSLILLGFYSFARYMIG